MTPAAKPWATRHRENRDAAFQALYAFGWHPLGDKAPTPLVGDLARAATDPVIDLARRFVEAMALDLSDEARLRLEHRILQKVVAAAIWAIPDAIADELTTTEPEPYAPPPAGSWVRNRYHPESADPKWDGKWHLFGGDVTRGDARTNDVNGRASCGARLHLRNGSLFDDELFQDVAVAETMPSVDACRRCARAA